MTPGLPADRMQIQWGMGSNPQESPGQGDMSYQP
jgi:hypothetical protein